MHFASVVLDVDSTLSAIEGIDWLAELRGPAVASEVAALTHRAMAGAIALDAVYAHRLALVRPTEHELTALGAAYVSTVAPGAATAIARWQHAGLRVVIVSGGLRAGILPLAQLLGIADDDVHAVPLAFDAAGDFHHVVDHPLTTPTGKRHVVESLALPSPVLAVGDGATDAAIKPAAAAFAAFVGYVRRESVVQQADFVVTSFDDLAARVVV